MSRFSPESSFLSETLTNSSIYGKLYFCFNVTKPKDKPNNIGEKTIQRLKTRNLMWRLEYAYDNVLKMEQKFVIHTLVHFINNYRLYSHQTAFTAIINWHKH